MAQTRSESPRQTDARAQPARAGDAAPTLSDLDAANDPSGSEPLDLAQQIDSLLNEIEQVSAAADPWGDASQRAADRVKNDEERTLEPSQKLLAKVREGVPIGVPEATVQADVALAEADLIGAVADLGVSSESPLSAAEIAPEIAAEPDAEALEQALEAELNESQVLTGEPAAAIEAVAAAEPTEQTLAAELDAALKEAGDALEQIVPPEDPPVEAAAEPAVTSVAAETVDGAAASPVPAVEPSGAAHWTNTGTPVGADPALAPVSAGEPAKAASSETPVDADDLDAALAAQAEELEESSRAVSAAAPAPAAAPAGAALADGAHTEAQPATETAEQPGSSGMPTESLHGTAHSTVTASAAAAHATKHGGANAPVVVPEAKPVKVPAPAKVTLPRRVRAAFSKVGNVLAMPLALLPESARDIVAYLAAVTVFNALAVWSYMLLIHSPPVPPPMHDAPALHATEPAAQAHGGHGDAHGTGAHGAADHGSAQTEGHGTASAGVHGEKPVAAPAAGHEEKPAHGDSAGHDVPHEPAPH